MKKFEYLNHTADLKFRAYGLTLKKVFKNTVKAMFKSIYKGKVSSEIKKEINIKGKNLEELMYNFLEEFIFLVETEGFFFSKFKKLVVDKNKHEINAIVMGDYIGNYKISFDIKAVTYNEMFVKKIKNKWVSQVVLDV